MRGVPQSDPGEFKAEAAGFLRLKRGRSVNIELPRRLYYSLYGCDINNCDINSCDIKRLRNDRNMSRNAAGWPP